MRALLALVLLAVALVACDGDEDATPASTSPSATQVLKPTPEVTPDRTPPSPPVELTEVTFVEEGPESAELLLAVILMGTDAPPQRLERAIVSGEEVSSITESLPQSAAGEWDYINVWRNIAYPPTSSGGPLILSMCDGQCGGLDAASPDARTVLIRSDDLGATWSEPIAVLDGPFWVIGSDASGERVLLLRQFLETDPRLRYYVWPEMTEAVPVPGAEMDRGPTMTPDGRVAWWLERELLTADGEVVLSLDGIAGPADNVTRPVFHANGERAVVYWNHHGAVRWTVFESRGDGTYEAVNTLAMTELSANYPYAWASETVVLAPGDTGIEHQSVITMVDVELATMTVIEVNGPEHGSYVPVAGTAE